MRDQSLSRLKINTPFKRRQQHTHTDDTLIIKFILDSPPKKSSFENSDTILQRDSCSRDGFAHLLYMCLSTGRCPSTHFLNERIKSPPIWTAHFTLTAIAIRRIITRDECVCVYGDTLHLHKYGQQMLIVDLNAESSLCCNENCFFCNFAERYICWPLFCVCVSCDSNISVQVAIIGVGNPRWWVY